MQPVNRTPIVGCGESTWSNGVQKVTNHLNPFAPGDFAEKCVLKVLEWFSGHCPAIKS